VPRRGADPAAVGSRAPAQEALDTAADALDTAADALDTAADALDTAADAAALLVAQGHDVLSGRS
jgi:hypothetical protein